MSDATRIVLVLAALLCSLVAGFLFAFAVVVMPGIRRLGDAEYLRAFKEMDGVIQRGGPMFGLVWAGSVVAVLAGVAMAVGQVSGADRVLLGLAAAGYLLGVQLPTFVVNVPLNNELQALDIGAADDASRRSARERFESRWNRWNVIRTVVGVLVSAMLLAVLIRV